MRFKYRILLLIISSFHIVVGSSANRDTPTGSSTSRAAALVHTDPQPLSRSTPSSITPGEIVPTTPNERTVIGGHGLVLIPIGRDGKLVETDGGEEVRLISIGGTTFQVVGTEITLNGQPLETDRGGDSLGGIDDTPLSPGEASALEFAKAAERIQKEKSKNSPAGGIVEKESEVLDGAGGMSADAGGEPNINIRMMNTHNSRIRKS
ncbi:hypothetical protein B0T17DRAFT_125998 [Bombardia bombarda]|uniref:Uncharacterized protein n=1 Tax=Bombardia bombarda TaxID=252184 RepID=A0AA39W9R2_9PEZI|nr:hypothetical protein B0T17DRAFT_125998 [Bombardia bombarda]